MTETRRCAKCSTEISPDSAQGLCPRCLLQAAMAEPTSLTNGDAGAGRTEWVPPSSPLDADPTPQPPAAPPSPEEIARHFPQLEVLELLGQGGMGVVYRARQRGLERDVALKILPARVGRDPAFAERFTREARALARLGHPNIVAVYDFGQTGGLYYFIMEYVDGADVRRLLKAGQISPREALSLVPQICDALEYAHDEGVVHRDIKPENILVSRKGKVKIADFGLAKLVTRRDTDLSLTGPQHVMGTPRYMAPEQMEKPLEVDHRADIYSLGVVIYELLTGELPLGRFPLPSERAPVDGRLDEVVLKTLEKDPGRRYQRVGELKTDLEAASKAPVEATSRSRARRAWVAAAAAVIAVVIGALLLVLWPRGQGDVKLSGKSAPDVTKYVAELADPARSFDRKETAWNKILGAGLVDEALGRLERLAGEAPGDFTVKVELGVGQIKKLTLARSDQERSTLGRRADALFNEALGIDPKDWRARFYKATSLSFWPPVFGKMGEAIRIFEELVADQEAWGDRDKRPEHAQAYIFLGNIYQQQGNSAKALATWKRGAIQFPADKDLAELISAAGPQKPE